MSCILRICGNKQFDIDKFDIGWEIMPVTIHRKGDISFISRHNNVRIKKSQLIYNVSDKEFSDINGQIKDAIKFLKKNSKYLKNVSKNKAIDSFILDFSFNLRIDRKTVEVQNDYFPAELIKLAGKLNIGIWLTQCPYEKLKKRRN